MKQRLIFCYLGITFVVLAGCQSGNILQNHHLGDNQASKFLDDKFNGYKVISIETEIEIFALSAEMKTMAKSISLECDVRKKATKLLEHFLAQKTSI
ncbi:hypothetical protein [Colwellia sp. C1TZA3]|uniref:hypothetical protein n=1 Tax=Colwellia sp. C1TZA3 TaxID=2508879 RepID=UPI0011B957CE|nr:hypothetical protein [Colwellia sp. C1TZA3]TWX73752.1 hypothetical protein ESZ39_02025 [Colwellia sp. C1TZA3]